ncbi:MAG: BadF/BadG/BcrA/BcrD ATPase family protein, partial [Coriobacteriaceae bacterium]|nr:BadF/BadG/BcrA/BcrD ATPase family protein [Coriobacteriaceae bacterium]
MSYRIGIDAGSKTIKLVVLDEQGKIVHSVYEKHRAAIRETLVEVIHNLCWRYGDIVGPVAITGSAGLGISQVLGLPFVQEVVATTKAVRQQVPDADAVIELGGEDAKVVFLTGGLEQRMNATCAGGTGGFIDNIAFMLGVRSEQMNNLAMSSTQLYPIASRCAVFAQTDVRPLLNAGVKKSDIAASALEAVVRQTLGGLCCGRPIRGKVVFLGGPLEHIPELVRRFRLALGLSRDNGIKPADAHLFTARGAALAAGEQGAPAFSLKVLERRISACPDPEDDLSHLPPLFETDADRIEFDRRHARQNIERSSIYSYEGDAFLGIDAGSTTVKLALVAHDGSLLYSDYKPVEGDCLKVASTMLGSMYRLIPKHYSSKVPYIRVAQSCVTGYGEELLKAALRLDGGVVETVAHFTAARAFDQEASFVLDIGGQDMKAMWLDEGEISDILLNEACSSGCGSFIEGTAYSLQTRPHPFCQAALAARNPIDLGTKCTVVMTSRVRHAQKIGAPLGDIAAGIAYSVVKNALYRIIGRGKVSSMGEHIVVQGGAFKSDAVLRAFELVAGVEVTRPDTAHLMGAIGAALVARQRAGETPQSTTLGEAELRALSYERSAKICSGCANSCRVNLMDFGGGRRFVSGNRCSRAGEFFPQAKGAAIGQAPNVVAVQQSLLSRYGSEPSVDPVLGGITVGIMDTLLLYEQLPFWKTLVRSLGFSVKLPRREDCVRLRLKAAESISSESACQAAKIAHERLFALADAGVDAVFMPSFWRRGSCVVASCYAEALADSAAAVLEPMPPMASPCFEERQLGALCANPRDRAALLEALCSLCPEQGQQELASERFSQALEEALAAQQRFEESVRKASESALEWLDASDTRHAVLLAGRPYHKDPALLHGIDEVAADMGLAVIPALGLGYLCWAVRTLRK